MSSPRQPGGDKLRPAARHNEWLHCNTWWGKLWLQYTLAQSREYIGGPCIVIFKTCLQWINRWRWWSLRNRYCEKSWNGHISHIINYFWNWLWIINILIGVGGIRKYPGHDSWRFVTASLSRGTSRQVTWHVTGVTTDSDRSDSS